MNKEQFEAINEAYELSKDRLYVDEYMTALFGVLWLEYLALLALEE